MSVERCNASVSLAVDINHIPSMLRIQAPHSRHVSRTRNAPGLAVDGVKCRGSTVEFYMAGNRLTFVGQNIRRARSEIDLRCHPLAAVWPGGIVRNFL